VLKIEDELSFLLDREDTLMIELIFGYDMEMKDSDEQCTGEKEKCRDKYSALTQKIHFLIKTYQLQAELFQK